MFTWDLVGVDEVGMGGEHARQGGWERMGLSSSSGFSEGARAQVPAQLAARLESTQGLGRRMVGYMQVLRDQAEHALGKIGMLWYQVGEGQW
jgi:hypothetical protein